MHESQEIASHALGRDRDTPSDKMEAVSLLGSVLAAIGAVTTIGASGCCAGPLILLLLGVTGPWVSALTVLSSYQPYFLAAAVIFLGVAFHKICVVPRGQGCAHGAACVIPQSNRAYKILFWLAAGLVLAAMIFAYLLTFY